MELGRTNETFDPDQLLHAFLLSVFDIPEKDHPTQKHTIAAYGLMDKAEMPYTVYFDCGFQAANLHYLLGEVPRRLIIDLRDMNQQFASFEQFRNRLERNKKFSVLFLIHTAPFGLLYQLNRDQINRQLSIANLTAKFISQTTTTALSQLSIPPELKPVVSWKDAPRTPLKEVVPGEFPYQFTLIEGPPPDHDS